MDPQVQLRLSMQERASIVPAEVLYRSRRDDAHHRVYMHILEEAMLVTSNQVDRTFIQPESFNQLQRSGMRFLHMGVIQVRIQIVHRQEEGTLLLLSSATTDGKETKLYLLLWKLISLMGANCHGVRALPGRRYNTREVQGHNWIIRQSTVSIPMQPTEVNTRNLLDGNVSLQFDTYQAATLSSQVTYNVKDEEVPSDEEEITNHIIAVFTETGKGDEELLVRRISATAVLPKRRSPGATGYDLAVDYAKNIAPYEKILLTTGICIQVLEGLYARIAPRSSAALRGIIIMGGVIDADYRGEVKILAYNTTNEDIYIEKQECIAQLILEHIATPQVKEVETLQQTARGVMKNVHKNMTSMLCKEDTLKLKGKAIQTASEKRLEALSRKARDYRITQHKFYEEEAYLNLIEGPPTIASSLAQTA
ncbi:hypothetical protein ZIOFF_012380 [Zingiber officinale]|uniref:dUTP diphosphatase n=1 Tax=Zingiber officinale TaxID=94328 RepID=A0A8J5HLK6_ZINOF|nr:hypothetical protein ZIOFF_012380 [Zingiber officinale]